MASIWRRAVEAGMASAPSNDAHSQPPRGLRKGMPWLAMTTVLASTILLLHLYGRRCWCECGEPWLWVNDSRGRHNSQHLADPYSFTHVLHGVVYFWLFAWLLPRLALSWRLCLSTILAAAWELIENSNAVIERYRAATVSVGYFGDSIANSLGDILSCGVGFYLARWLGMRWSIVCFFLIEGMLLFWIRDDLLLTIIMPIWPIEAIKNWQMGG
jgi:hypothetical protein